MNAWTTALAPETVAAIIPEAHVRWLESAKPGSRLAVKLDDPSEWGHVYPDVPRNPEGWICVAHSDHQQETQRTPGGDR